MTVAKTILEQLGGPRFLVMTGARGLVGSENSLSFKVPNAAKKITQVIITIMPSDTYKMEFINCRMAAHGLKREIISSFDDVYCDQLQKIFTEETALYTHI